MSKPCERKIINPIKNIEWPDGRKFAVCLTHDVDRVKKTYQYFSDIVLKRDLRQFCRILGDTDPYWNFENLMEIEEKFAVRSTLFFLNEKKKFNMCDPRNWKLTLGRYSLFDPAVLEIMKRLRDKGWEIGLHGSYDSYMDPGQLQKEKSIVEEILHQRINGIRQHYLNLAIPDTWEAQRTAGFRYDSTFGLKRKEFNPIMNWHPFLPFDDSFVVIPITIMDTYLFRMRRSISDIWDYCEKIIVQGKSKGGVITLLWHQRVFNSLEFPIHMEIYERFISRCSEEGAYFGTCGEIASWWRGSHLRVH